ncbi:MAG TPA: hypothetical protein VGJ41_14555 [Nocardioides sp.]|jgi:hypothetical protein
MHLVMLFGPPAAGKMTVGAEIARLTGYKLFHNHLSIEPVLEIFDWGTPAFSRLTEQLRRGVIEEAVRSDLPGLIFTFVWALDLPEDHEYVARLLAPAFEAGCRVDFVELVADQATRLTREGTAYRLEHKRSKRDVDWCRAHLVEMDEQHRFQTHGEPLAGSLAPHLVVDNSGTDAAATARVIVDQLGLRRGGPASSPGR